MSSKRPFIVRLVRALWRLASDRDSRNTTWLRLTRPKGVFQPNNDTADNRYPKIFRFVQSELGANSDLKILSFGCSTGEEVFSLRRYFPRATIKGIDINRLNVASARRRLRGAPDKAITFETAGSCAGEPSASYDAIFCMGVLRHGGLAEPGITRCDHLIRFEDFASAVADFSRCLKPGGLLVIRHSNFRLADAPAATGFETALRVKIAKSERLKLFGPDNRLLQGAVYPDVVFCKARV